MPKLTKIQQATRIAQVLHAIVLMQNGATRLDALLQVGLTADQFYDWIEKSSEAVDAFYGLIQSSEKRELVSILTKRETILDNLLNHVSQPTANNLDILATLAYLDHRQSDLETKQGVSNNAEIQAQEYLKGPRTEKKPSRLTATVTIEGTGKVTVSTEEHEIIDGVFAPDQGHSSPPLHLTPHEALLEEDLEGDRIE